MATATIVMLRPVHAAEIPACGAGLNPTEYYHASIMLSIAFPTLGGEPTTHYPMDDVIMPFHSEVKVIQAICGIIR